MKRRLTAILLHGMGHAPSWWTPFVPRLEDLGLDVLVPTLPDLASADPDAWVAAALAAIPDTPTILIGHSLGAAVALQAAWRKPVQGVILMAMPVVGGPIAPKRPRSTTLSLAALSRVGRFLIQTARGLNDTTCGALHFVGDCDAEIGLAQAQQLPLPLICLPGADHNLNRRESDIRTIVAHIACSPAAQQWLDPAARRSASLDARMHISMPQLTGSSPPPPARLDIEVTTRCQLQCRHCARTLFKANQAPVDMSPALFERILDEAEFAGEIVFVGLGEPLLHPQVDLLVKTASKQGRRMKVVTNGLAADPERLSRLRDAGLQEVTFSIDSTDAPRFSALRGDAALEVVLRHFSSVPSDLQKSIFVTLSQANAADLGELAKLARNHGLPAIAVSDVNFGDNAGAALHGGVVDKRLAAGLATAREAGVLVLGPHLHEVRDPTRDYRHCLVRSVSDLSARAARHTHCLAPWRIAVIGASGEVTPCNCAPQHPVGSLERESLRQVWTGAGLKTWRKSVTQGTNPDCLVCPRF